VLSPGNRAKPCKFRYVKSVRNFTWKLCYRKDDRAMRPIRGCPENFRDFLTTPTATIHKIFHGLLFRSTLWMFLQNLKSVAFLPVPKIIVDLVVTRTVAIWPDFDLEPRQSSSRLKSTTWMKCDLTRLENTIDLSRLKTDLDNKKSVLCTAVADKPRVGAVNFDRYRVCR